MRAIIVGAGIVGAACADELSRAGCAVHIVDSAFCGGGTTAAGMGHLVVMDDSPAQFSLTKLSVELWREMAMSLSVDVEFDPCGTLWVAADEEELAAARDKVAVYAELGVEAHLVSGKEVAALEPMLRSGLAGGMRIPNDSVVYPTNAARFLISRAIKNGATAEENRHVASIEPGIVIFTDGSKAVADAVINAAGAHAADLSPELPIKPRRGHLAITDRYPGAVHHQVLELGYLKSAHSTQGPSVAFNVQPRKTGQLLIGSSREFAGWDETINQELLAQMLTRAITYMPALGACSVIRSWVGFRPATPDKLPVVGELQPGLWVAAGHEGLGITTSLGSARILADQMLGRVSGIDVRPFDPHRFGSAAESPA